MKKHIEFFIRYICFWMLMFVLMRFMFIMFNGKIASGFEVKELGMSFLHGLRLDLSTSAYLTVIPLFIWVIAQYASVKVMDYVLTTYNILVILTVTLISLLDAELYVYWGQKLNAYASSFAKFPKEMFSFSSGISWGKLIFFGLLCFFLVRLAYDNIPFKLREAGAQVKAWVAPVVLVVMSALLFLMIRGNFGMSAINQSFAYFSDKPFLNHAAVNTTWNFVASLVDQTEDEKKNPYSFTGDDEARLVTDSLLARSYEASSFKISAMEKPDILLILLEGWTADVVAYTGGEPDITPNLNALAASSLAYTNFYANGNRTDKGLAAVLSAQPTLAKSSIINKLQKFSGLPAIPTGLSAQGYHSKFVYGGEAEFANMKAYWLNCGFGDIIDIHHFDKAVLPESWGVHDDELYAKLLKEYAETPTPRFVAALTLSSHEPYKVPHTSRFSGSTEADKYRNAVHYADECLGKFLDEAKKQPWYNNTLIFILPDHAHQEPLNRKPFEPARFHTPFIVSGGALNPELRGVRVSRYAQQTDIAPTILKLAGVNKNPFAWGMNLFDTTSHGFATYTYNDGIGFMSPKGFVVYDYESKKKIMSEGNDTVAQEKAARSYHQVFYNEYLSR